jgi:hypothetical protein
MNELVLELVRKIEKGEGFMGNEKDLALLDAEEFGREIEALQEKLEDVEYHLINAEEWVEGIVDTMVKKELGVLFDDDTLDEFREKLKIKLVDTAYTLVFNE